MRTNLFKPEHSLGGPDPRHLEDKRITTTKRQDDSTTTTHTDNWRNPNRSETTLKYSWTGTTVFTEKTHYPQLLLDDCADEAAHPKGLPTPNEPTPQEKELHNLTHAIQSMVSTMCAVQGPS